MWKIDKFFETRKPQIFITVEELIFSWEIVIGKCKEMKIKVFSALWNIYRLLFTRFNQLRINTRNRTILSELLDTKTESEFITEDNYSDLVYLFSEY